MKATRTSAIVSALGLSAALSACDPMDTLDRVGSCGIYGSDAACDAYASRYAENQAAANHQYQQSLRASENDRLRSQYIDRSPVTSVDMATWSWLNGTWCDRTTRARTFAFEIKASGRSAMFVYNPNLKVSYSYDFGHGKDSKPLGFYVSPRYREGLYEIWFFSQFGEEFSKTRTIISKISDTRFFIKSNLRLTFDQDDFEPLWHFSQPKSALKIRDADNKTNVYSYHKCTGGQEPQGQQATAGTKAAQKQQTASSASTPLTRRVQMFQRHVQEARRDEKAARTQHPSLGWLNGVWCDQRTLNQRVPTNFRIKVLDPGRLKFTEVDYDSSRKDWVLRERVVRLVRVDEGYGEEFEYTVGGETVFRVRKVDKDKFRIPWLESIDKATGKRHSRLRFEGRYLVRCTELPLWGV